MNSDTLKAIGGAVGALLVGILAALITLFVERRKYRVEITKLMSGLTSVSEVEKARIHSYADLWARIEGISAHRPKEIVSNLPKVQALLQQWYYSGSGGLTIAGSYEQPESTKGAFFAARELTSNDPSEIWQVFHHLRRCLRRDLKIFEDEQDENKMIEQTKAKLKLLGQ